VNRNDSEGPRPQTPAEGHRSVLYREVQVLRSFCSPTSPCVIFPLEAQQILGCTREGFIQYTISNPSEGPGSQDSRDRRPDRKGGVDHRVSDTTSVGVEVETENVIHVAGRRVYMDPILYGSYPYSSLLNPAKLAARDAGHWSEPLGSICGGELARM